MQKEEKDGLESGVRSFYDLVTRESSVACSVVSILLSPRFRLCNGARFVVLPVVCNSLIEGIIYIGCRHKSLDGQKDSLNLEGGRPFVFKNIEANAAESIDVGVVDLGAEEALGGNHGVVFRQEELKVEETTFVGGVCGTSNLHEEVSAVSLRGLCVDSHDGLLSKSLRFF